MNNLDIRQGFHLNQAELTINNTYSGLLGGFTPGVRWHWLLNESGWAEQTAFAVSESTDDFPFDVASIQPIWIRYLNVTKNGELRYAQYVNTFEQYPYYCYNKSAGAKPFPTELECNGGNAIGYYGALLDFVRLVTSYT